MKVKIPTFLSYSYKQAWSCKCKCLQSIIYSVRLTTHSFFLIFPVQTKKILQSDIIYIVICCYFTVIMFNLQVIFIAGILTGIALTIAGSVLHGNQREGDLVVLMYIGVLLVLVCILLLSVHCCVRRNVKQRKRALRMTLMDGSRRLVHPVSGDFTAIPVQDFTADANYRNSFAETNLNEFEVADSSRAQLNVIPNPTYNYQYRQSTTNRSGGFQMNAGRPAHDWGRSSHPTGVHRSSFR